MELTPLQLEAARHQAALETYCARHFDLNMWDAMERRALIKHRPKKRFTETAAAGGQPQGLTGNMHVPAVGVERTCSLSTTAG